MALAHARLRRLHLHNAMDDACHSPGTVLVVPAILIIYLVISEDKRVAAQYSLKKKKGAAGAVKWDVTKSVDEYMQVLNKRITFDEDRREDLED